MQLSDASALRRFTSRHKRIGQTVDIRGHFVGIQFILGCGTGNLRPQTRKLQTPHQAVPVFARARTVHAAKNKTDVEQVHKIDLANEW